MRRVLCSLVVLAILVGMFVCLGAQAFAAEEDIAVFAVTDEQLSPDDIALLGEQCAEAIVLDADGMADGQSELGYNLVWRESDPVTMNEVAYIWPGFAQLFNVGPEQQPVVLIGVGTDSTAEEVAAAISSVGELDEKTILIAVGPAEAAAAVQDQVKVFLAAGNTDGAITDMGSTKVINVGKTDAPVAAVFVDKDGNVTDAQNIAMPEAAEVTDAPAESPEPEQEPAVGDMSIGVGPGTGPVAQLATIYFAGGEGAEGSMEPQQAAVGTAYVLPDNSGFSRAGYDFVGWTAGDGTEVGVGGSYTVSGETTFTAKWEQTPEPAVTSFTVTYKSGDARSQSDVTVSVSQEQAEGYILNGEDTFQAPESKAFGGWKDDDGIVAGAYSPYPITGDETFVAQWADVYTVSFDPGEGIGDVTSEKVTGALEGGTEYGLPGCSFTAPDGKVFAGWKADDGTETVYTPAPGQVVTYTLTKDVTFTAQWSDAVIAENSLPKVTELPERVATFESGIEGIEAKTFPTRYYDSISLDVSFNNMPEGKVISGWKLQGDESGKIYSTVEQFTMPDNDVTFIAQWSASSATLTYAANNGSDASFTETVELLSGAAQHTLPNLPESFTAPDGKTFGGWLIGENNACQPNAIITVNGDMQIAAKWDDIQKDINQNPGATTTGDVNYTQGGTDTVTLSYANASIAAVFVDNGQLVPNQDYTLGQDGKSFTFINGYLNKLSVGTHGLNVTFQETDTATFISDPRNLVIAAAPVQEAADSAPVSHIIEQNWDRSQNLVLDFSNYGMGYPVKLEIDYGSQGMREAVKDRDYSINGYTVTLYPAMVNGNWGVWGNARYAFRVTFEGANSGISTVSTIENTQDNYVTLRLQLTGNAPAAATATPVPTNASGLPVTGDDTPVTMYIVILVVLVVALAAVLIIVMKRRGGDKGRH